MKKFIQDSILAIYRLVLATGILRTRPGLRAYEALYTLYKKHFEATDMVCLEAYVRPGATVIDVGAFIGFFALRFARWVGPRGRVIAIEPDTRNFTLLRRAIGRAGLDGVVDTVHGVAAERPGTLHLRFNPHHPADHRLGQEGIPVTAYTLDGLMAERGWPRVSLVKIDVQGAELRVLRGAKETLARFRPVLFIEIDDRALAEADASASEVIAELETLGYRPYLPSAGGAIRPLDPHEAARHRAALGYADYLFLADDAARRISAA